MPGERDRRPQGSYRANTTFGLRVPGALETTVGTNSLPAWIAFCIAARNASSIFSLGGARRHFFDKNNSSLHRRPHENLRSRLHTETRVARQTVKQQKAVTTPGKRLPAQARNVFSFGLHSAHASQEVDMLSFGFRAVLRIIGVGISRCCHFANCSRDV